MTLYAVRGPNPNRSRTLFHVLLSVVTHSLLDEGDDDTVRCTWPKPPAVQNPVSRAAVSRDSLGVKLDEVDDDTVRCPEPCCTCCCQS